MIYPDAADFFRVFVGFAVLIFIISKIIWSINALAEIIWDHDDDQPPTADETTPYTDDQILAIRRDNCAENARRNPKPTRAAVERPKPRPQPRLPGPKN